MYATTQKEALVGAKEALVQYGRIKGKYGHREYGFCLAGAVRFAVTGSAAMPLNDRDYGLVSATLATVEKRIQRSATLFNDNSTDDEVFAVLDEVIASLPD